MQQSLTFTFSDADESVWPLSAGVLAGMVVGVLSLVCVIIVVVYVFLGRRRAAAHDECESDQPPQTIEFVSGTIDESTVLGTTETMTTEGSELMMPLLPFTFSTAPPSSPWA
jgi:hypothetical protein